jgi:NAD(P)-dependent dehydrogenase (short-subunit alcohol dehydrogenase family)
VKSTIVVTGSSDGIGAEIANQLVQAGHRTIRHARSAARRQEILAGLPADAEVVTGDLTSLHSTLGLVEQLRSLGPIDVLIHNAGWATSGPQRVVTPDGLEATFQINTLAGYVLSALLTEARRIVFVASDSISRAHVDFDDLQHEKSWSADRAYADSKLAMVLVAFGWAHRYPKIISTAVHPGWVRTKMSGGVAPLSTSEGADTPVWLATSQDPAALESGRFFHNRAAVEINAQAYDVDEQQRMLEICADLSMVPLPNCLDR